jgi:hypothetical protein
MFPDSSMENARPASAHNFSYGTAQFPQECPSRFGFQEYEDQKLPRMMNPVSSDGFVLEQNFSQKIFIPTSVARPCAPTTWAQPDECYGQFPRTNVNQLPFEYGPQTPAQTSRQQQVETWKPYTRPQALLSKANISHVTPPDLVHILSPAQQMKTESRLQRMSQRPLPTFWNHSSSKTSTSTRPASSTPVASPGNGTMPWFPEMAFFPGPIATSSPKLQLKPVSCSEYLNAASVYTF